MVPKLINKFGTWLLREGEYQGFKVYYAGVQAWIKGEVIGDG